MVDIHSHILPGLDDGAADLQTAVDMCRAAAAGGTREIVATPKATPRHPLDLDEVRAKVAELQERVGDQIHIHYGADLRLEWDTLNAAVADPFRYSINHRQYLLMEFGDDVLSRGAGKALDRFRDAGVVPIISQPERRLSLGKDRARLANWASKGCLIQISAGSLTGLYGESIQLASFHLMDAGLAHFVASDARTLGSRGADLRPAYDFVVYRWGEERARRLFLDHPWAALWGLEIESGRTRVRRRRLLPKLRIPFFQPKRRRRRRRRSG